MNVAQLLVRAARAFPDRLAIAHGEAPHVSYRELARRAAVLARYLRDTLGLQTADRVGLFMKNGPAYLEVLLASWWAGLTPVPINAKLHPLELAYILENAGARLCFVSFDLGQAAASVAGAVRLVDVESTEYARALAGNAEAPIQWNVPDDVAWLFYTSGTTGRPKGVMISHRNLLAMTLCYFADVDRIDAGDCIIHAAPMSHGSGLYALPHLAAAVTNVIPESGGFEAAEIFTLAKRWPGVAMFAAPTMVKRLVDYARATHPPLDGVKSIIYGGGPMYLEDIKNALAVMGQRFAQIYGQGESPMAITALAKCHLAAVHHPRYDARLASVGIAQTAVEVRVVDAQDRTLPVGEAGEVAVRGDTVMRGYWGNAAATAQAMKHGWLHTGDVGALDADGFLTLLDRSKDMIISGGSNIYPREVEEVLLRHPDVSEVSVVGRKHAEWGEEVVAFVVKRAGADLAAAALDRLCMDHIARFKRPRVYRFVSSLPKNNYGKVLKTELRAWLENDSSA
jgi:long-chain acyl-CoA synthetase